MAFVQLSEQFLQPRYGYGQCRGLRHNAAPRSGCGTTPERAINVAPYFADGQEVTELYTGEKAVVRGGKVKFSTYSNNIALVVAE